MSYDELFNNLRQKLDVLGYHQPLPLAAVPLAGALFEDLIKTTESLRDAKLQLSNLLEEKSCWELGVEPYKCDNSRLLAECNALHLELIKQRDSFDEQICDYARKIRNLESDKRCLEDHCIELESQIRDLNLRHADSKFSKTKKNGINMNKKPFITTVRTGTLLPSPLLEPPHPISTKCAKCNSILWARQAGGANNTEIEKLQNDAREKADQAALYKKKVDERDREIRRLNDLLRGGRPPQALAKDCCYKNVGTLSEDVETLQKEKVENCVMIRELQEAMHEAKQRAVDLAERNKRLERELKEFKDAALLVEQRANEELSKKENEISELCDEIRKLKRQRPDSNDRRPDRSVDEKRRLNERLNEMIHREKELEAEIDRMAAKNCKLRNKIVALQKENEEKRDREDKSVSTEIDEERIRLKSERDLFQKEYLRLVEKSGSSQEVCLLRTQLKEKEDELKNLHSELCHLRSQTARSIHDKITPSSTSISVQAAIIRAERERDIARAELDRVKAERDILREKLQYSTGAQVTETDRFKRELQELNARICQLQAENRELLSSQVPGQTHIILLKEEMEELRKRLNEVQNENCQINTRYNQLKLLHEQTERALVDYQNKHAISETNLRNAESRLACLSSNRDSTRSDICSLQNEIAVLKSANATLEAEKDKILNDLDKKTEKLYRAENELKLLKTKREELEYTVQSLESRLDKVTSERRVRESELHETSTESKTLRQQITTLKEIRDQTIAENGRLSNELADAKADHSLTKKKLKESEKEVDRLKQQLQSYVQKVQRAEDLLMQKEREREEMLDHYRTLSHDAIALEGNNQSLEMEAAEFKRQLLEAEQEIARLKQEINIKDCTIEKLEKQVSCLSAQICRLEKDLEQAYDDQKLLKADLDAIKELCEKLDLQSEKQNAELQERGEIISKLEKENLELRSGSSSTPKGKATTDILQDLLAKSRQELEEERRAVCKLAQEKLDLRKTIEEIQKNLEAEREKATQKEALAKEYSVQIQEMQHNLTDDRFQKARSREQSPRNHESKGCNVSPTNRLKSGCCNCSRSLREAQNDPSEASPDRYCCTCRSNDSQNYRYLAPSSEISSRCCRHPSSKSKIKYKTKSKSNSKSQSSSLKSMKSILNGVHPCKQKNLIGDVNNFLGRKSCKFEETVSFDEDSDDIIVCRKRFVETKRFKGYKGDEPSSEAFGSVKSSSPKEQRKNVSPKSKSISDIAKSKKSLESMYTCQCTSDSENKGQSYTPGISVELTPKRSSSSKRETPSLSNITMFSKDPEVQNFLRNICSKKTDSTPSATYANDSEMDRFCQILCGTNEKMSIKPYVKRNSNCACELKYNPYWLDAKVMQKRSSSTSKPRQSKVETKTRATRARSSDSKSKEEIEKCIRSCNVKSGSNDSKSARSDNISSSIKSSDAKDKEIEKCIEKCKVRLRSNSSKSSPSKERSPIPKDSDTKGEKEIEKCIEECKSKLSSNVSKSSDSKERSPIPKYSDKRGEKEIEKCIEECKLKLSSNGSKLSDSTGRPSTPLKLTKSTKDMSKEDVIKIYKEEMEKCLQKCNLKCGLIGSKKEGKRSSISSTSSKIKTDTDSKEMEALQEELSKTSESLEEKNIKVSNMKDNKKIEECVKECRLKLGSKEIVVKERDDEKDKEKCIQECKAKFAFKDVKKESIEDSKKMEKLSSPLKKPERKDDTSTEELMRKYKKEIENCIRECKVKFGSQNLKEGGKESTQQKRSPSPLKTRKSIEDTEDTSEDVNTNKKEETEKCIRECQLKFGVKDSKHASRPVVKTDSSEYSNQMKKTSADVKKDSKPLTATKRCVISSSSSKITSDMDSKDSKEIALQKGLPCSSKCMKIKEDTSTDDFMKCKEEVEKFLQECKLKYDSRNLKEAKESSSSSRSVCADTKKIEKPFQKRLSSSSKPRKYKEEETTGDTSTTDDINTKDKWKMEKCTRECKSKFDSKDSKKANSTDSSTSPRTKYSSDEKCVRYKDFEKCKLECKSKFDEKLAKEKSASKLKKEIEESKLTKLASEFSEEFYDAQDLNSQYEDESETKEPIKKGQCIKDSAKQSIGTIGSNSCGQETIDLLANFCASLKKAIERENDCPQIIALNPKIDKLCADVSTNCEAAESTKSLPSVIEIQQKVDQITIDDTLSGNVEKAPSCISKKADDSNKCGNETTALVKKFCGNTKETNEKEKDCSAVVPLKGKIVKFCTDVTSTDKLAANESELEESRKKPSAVIKSADDSNAREMETAALIESFCRIIREVIEREKNCPLVVELKPMIEQFCVDVAGEDKPESGKTCPLDIESKGEEPDLTKRSDDCNVCEKATTNLAENFCESTKKAMEREKDCPAVIALKPKIDEFCNDVTVNQQPGSAQRIPFQGCICMKDKYDRMMSIIDKRCSPPSSRGVRYYRRSIICKRSNDRFERTVIEKDGDGNSFDTSTLPPPPQYDRNEVQKRK